MDENELREIEKRLMSSCTNAITGEGVEWWVSRDSDYVEVSPADVRALIAEVRRLRATTGAAS